MKINPRLIRHLVFMLSLSLIPILYYSIIIYFEGSRGNPLYFGIVAVILSLNIIYSFSILKAALWKKVVFAITVDLIAYFLAAMLIRVGINVENDIWGIWTWIIGNAFFTIMAWEIIYQLTENSLSSTANSNL